MEKPLKKFNINTNRNIHFIGSYLLEDDALCENIIEYFNKNPDKVKPGLTASGMDTEKKQSLDLAVKPSQLAEQEYQCLADYMKKLVTCWEAYKDEWNDVSKTWNNLSIGTFNVQKYEPGGHFSQWHTERSGLINSHRQFAWMTYLDSQDEGGETEFLYYDISVKPIKGLTLIWPAEWSHTHRGNVVKTDKYIVTGWIDFLPPKKDFTSKQI